MIPLPKTPKITKKEKNKATIVIEPLYPGYGVTIGNSYRRVLLSSLEGSAITEVKIKGVKSEFDNIPGVIENVLMILINLKKIRVKNMASDPQRIKLSVKGEKEVKASDFITGPDVKIANPEEHIATISEKGTEFEIEAVVSNGVGYVPIEEMKRSKDDIEVLPLDAIFTPVKNVNFEIENVRVGKKTNFEKLELEILTDGTISAEDAFKEATDILLGHFSIFSDMDKKVGESEKESKEKAKANDDKKREKDKKEKPDYKKEKIENAELSEKIKEALIGNGIKTVGGLARKKEEDILKIEGVGKKAIEEIKKMLEKHNLNLK